MGPLIDTDAVNTMMQAIDKAKKDGGILLIGGEQLKVEEYVSGCYVKPTIIEASNEMEIVQEEDLRTDPMYLIKYKGDV